MAVLAMVVSLTLADTPRVSAQEDLWSIDALKPFTIDRLIYFLQDAQNDVDSAEGLVSRNPTDKHAKAYLDNCQAVVEKIRAAIQARGMRPPGIYVSSSAGGSAGNPGRTGGSAPGSRGSTAVIARPGANGTGTASMRTDGATGRGGAVDSRLAALGTGVALTMTAGEAASCAANGVSLADCAANLVLKTAQGLVVGKLILVLSPTGAIAATVIGVASAGGQIYLALEQAAGNYALDEQKRANAARITSADMAAIVASYTARLADARRGVPEPTAVNDVVSRLSRIVNRARADFEAFESFNRTTKLATARCADPSRSPLTYAAEADKRLLTLGSQADAIGTAVASATRLVAPCSGADAARQAKYLYQNAQRDLRELDPLRTDATADVEDAAGYFAAIGAARSSMPEAARRIAALEAAIEEVSRARTELSNATADYERAVVEHKNRVGAVLVSVHNLRGALPAELPSHIQRGLEQIDDAYTSATAEVLVASRQLAMERAAADDQSRVEGWLRAANEQFDDMRACGMLTGEMPDALRRDLARLTAGIASAYARAEQSVREGIEIPAKADACGRTTSVVPPSLTQPVDGRMSGECSGPIRAVPERGTVGSQLMIQVTIDPPFDTIITRLATDNPACRGNPSCDAQPSSQGRFRAALQFQAPPGATANGTELGRFRVRLAAYDKDNRIRCTGQTPELTVLAPPRR